MTRLLRNGSPLTVIVSSYGSVSYYPRWGLDANHAIGEGLPIRKPYKILN